MPLTYERDPKVPAAVGNQYPSVQPTNPFPIKESNDLGASYGSDQYAAPVTGSYPTSSSTSFNNPSTTSMHGSAIDAPLTSQTNDSSFNTSYGITPGSSYGSGTVQGTGIIHDEHIRDRTIPGQGIVYDDMKMHEKDNKNRDHAFVAVPEGANLTTVNPRTEGLASDASGRYDGFVAGPDGINSHVPKSGTHSDKAAAAAAAASSTTSSDSKTGHTSSHDMNDSTTDTDASGQKKGKIGQFFSNLTHKNTSPDKDPMQVYQDSLAQTQGSQGLQGTQQGTSSSMGTTSSSTAYPSQGTSSSASSTYPNTSAGTSF